MGRCHRQAIWLLLACTLLVCQSQYGISQKTPLPNTVEIMVWVRNGRGAPVAGLTAKDFTVTEDGTPDPISSVDNSFLNFPLPPAPNSAVTEPRNTAPSRHVREASWQDATYVLLILSPMSATGRSLALTEAIRYFTQAKAQKGYIALLDDAGTYIPFGQDAEQIHSALQKLSQHVSAPQLRGGNWISQANRAIEELAVMPGRHAIVFISDYESKLYEARQHNPWLERIDPSMFVDAAQRAQAALYTVQSSVPPMVVPFGEAASDDQYTGTGQQVANRIQETTVFLGQLRGDLLDSADKTGGVAVRDFAGAFGQIAADAAGYYLIRFQPHPHSLDGIWHPVLVAARQPYLHVKGPRYYALPAESVQLAIPADLEKALKNSPNSSALAVTANAWLFPDSRDTHMGVFAAAIDWAGGSARPGAGARLRVFAELTSDSMHNTAGSWDETIEWPAGGDRPLPAYWQREATLFPGAYTLKVIAQDLNSGKAGTGTLHFLARPLGGVALRFGPTVLAAGCLSPDEQGSARRNLFDPMRWEGCQLVPTPTGHFRQNQEPIILLRIYPPNEKFSQLIQKQWKARVVIDASEDPQKNLPLSITPAEVRGLAASGKLNLNALGLAPGAHRLTVIVEFPGAGRSKQQIPFETEITIDP